MPCSTVISAGNFNSLTSSPPSITEVTFTVLLASSTSTFDANVACGIPISSAT